MIPTLRGGQYVLVSKLIYWHFQFQNADRILPFVKVTSDGVAYPFHPPNRGDVIVFHSPTDLSRDFVKRVIGTPGDTVEMIDGIVFINGEALDEPYIIEKGNFTMALRTVPQDALFVLGDNRRVSDDSRKWGFLPMENIIGMAWVTYWPLAQWNFLQAFRWRLP